MAGFQFSGSGLSFGEKYSRTLDKNGIVQREPDAGKRTRNVVLSLIKDVLLAQAIIWLTIPILSLIGSHVLVNPNTLNVNETTGAILIPLVAAIAVVSGNLRRGKWYWAILNACMFIYITFSTKIPGSVLTAFDTNGKVFAIEACAIPAIIIFLIGSWKRLLGGGLGCAASWILYFALAYNFFVFDFYTVGWFGNLPIVPSFGHVRMPPYDFIIIAWSACGVEAIILAALAGLYILGELGGSVEYLMGNIRVSEKREKDIVQTYSPQQIAEIQNRINYSRPDPRTLYLEDTHDNWENWFEQLVQLGSPALVRAALLPLIISLGLPEGKAKDDVEKIAKNLLEASSSWRDIGNLINRYVLHKPEQKESPGDQALRKFQEWYHLQAGAKKRLQSEH